MPKFDHPRDRELWLSQTHPLLEAVTHILDGLFFILYSIYGSKRFPYRQVEVAPGGFIRAKGEKPSFHPLGQAIDVRTRDIDRKLLRLVLSTLAFLKKLKDGQIQHVFESAIYEDGKYVRGEHIHIEIDTGDPV